MTPAWRFAAGLALFVGAAGLVGAAQAEDVTCHIDGFETPVRCVTLEVPRDYGDPRGTTLLIGAAIVPAVTARPAPDPLILLAGGPGQAATDLGPLIGPAFSRVRQDRDIVLFDIRGTGRSSRFDCGGAPDGILGVQARDSSNEASSPAERMGAFARKCVARLGDGVLAHSFAEVVEDLERFRAAMGYERVNLWGGSFGTRIVQHYVRAHGEHVRAVVLDGAAPVGLSAFQSAPRTSGAALERLFDDCAADAACARSFPNLAAVFRSLLARTDAAPTVVRLPDPRTGRKRSYVFDGDSIRGVVFGGLYLELTRSLLPLAIAHAAEGDFAPLAAIGATTASWSSDTMSLASTLSVICAEDWQQANAQPASQRAAGFMGNLYFRTFDAACREWPVKPVPAGMFEPFTSSAAALAISGELDPVTPPALAAQAIAQFATSMHLVIPGAFHTNSTNPCAARVIAAFLEAPASGGRSQACLRDAARPRFFITAD